MTAGCVTVTVTDGAADSITPVFPASQVDAADPPGPVTFRGTTYAAGDQVTLTGGFPGAGNPPMLPSGERLEVPSGCPGTVFVVSPGPR